MKKYLLLILALITLAACQQPSNSNTDTSPDNGNPYIFQPPGGLPAVDLTNWDVDNIRYAENMDLFLSLPRKTRYKYTTRATSSVGTGIAGRLFTYQEYYTRYMDYGLFTVTAGYDTGSRKTDMGYYILRRANDGAFLIKEVDVITGREIVTYKKAYAGPSALKTLTITELEYDSYLQ